MLRHKLKKVAGLRCYSEPRHFDDRLFRSAYGVVPHLLARGG
jgi:hypothetical protein